jgi:hypothetical protein
MSTGLCPDCQGRGPRSSVAPRGLAAGAPTANLTVARSELRFRAATANALDNRARRDRVSKGGRGWSREIFGLPARPWP